MLPGSFIAREGEVVRKDPCPSLLIRGCIPSRSACAASSGPAFRHVSGIRPRPASPPRRHRAAPVDARRSRYGRGVLHRNPRSGRVPVPQAGFLRTHRKPPAAPAASGVWHESAMKRKLLPRSGIPGREETAGQAKSGTDRLFRNRAGPRRPKGCRSAASTASQEIRLSRRAQCCGSHQ